MKTIISFLFFFMVALVSSTAQVAEADPVYYIADHMPAWHGCENEPTDSLKEACFYHNLDKFIQENTVYPEIAKKHKTEGMIYAQFVVEKDGSISDIRILKGIGDDCDQEVVRVLKLVPHIIPGSHEGTPVRVLMKIPVNFKLK